MQDPIDLTIGSWKLKVQTPLSSAAPQRVIFLIHGWTGDERSMWVFASRLPKDALLIAPRAPYASNHPQFGGYSWVEKRAGEFSRMEAFVPALGSFGQLLNKLEQQYAEADFSHLGFVGFSQGAAFSFAYAMRHPDRVAQLAALAGFLPTDSESQLPALASLPVFIAHGTQDETVPVSMAREARTALESAGAHVRYCESDTGHKLGANCAAELSEFFK
jgi:phospholipase/carboxylesterase